MVVPATRSLARRSLTLLGTVVVGRMGGVTVVRRSTFQPKPAPGPVVRGEVLDSRDDPMD